MTTLTEDLEALLTTLAPAGGVWCDINTLGSPTYPFIVFQRIASSPNVSLLGPSDLQNTRFQIDIYTRTKQEQLQLETALENLMAAWAVQNVPLLAQDFYESEVQSFRCSRDYSVWAKN